MENKLLFKPNYAYTVKRLDAFWAGDMLDRPIVCITVAKKDTTPNYPNNYFTRMYDDLDVHVNGVVDNASKTHYLGEAIPSAFVSFGCDEMAAFCGGDLVFNNDFHDTNWSYPIVSDWEEFLPFEIKDDNKLWRRMLEYVQKTARASKGKMLFSPIDLHSNMDLLLAVRGAENLCMDLLDKPKIIDRAMESAHKIFEKVIYQTRLAGNIKPSTGATLQCDFACMISPEMFQKWALPYLELESEIIKRVTYHWDGVDALSHTESIIASKGLYNIAFVPGTGNGEHKDYIPLFQHIQDNNKAVSVHGSPEDIKWMHTQLKPHLTAYSTSVDTVDEAEELLEWFVKNS